MRFYPLLPWALILISAGLVYAAFILIRKYALELTPFRKNILFALRCASTLLLVLMLFSPGIVVRELNRKRANVVFLIDGSDSMSAADMPGGQTRFHAAREALQELMDHSYSGCSKYVYLFNQKTLPAENEDFLETVSPFGGTDLKNAFETIDRDIGLSRIAAVAVISDGLDHSGFTGAAGVPIYAVRTGTALERVPDLRISDFKIPAAIRPGEEIELQIPVELSGFSQKQHSILKAEADGKPILEEKLELAPGEKKQISLKAKFEVPGLHRIVLSLPKLHGEFSVLNNQRELLIEVKDEPVQPLIFFPVLGSSFRPLLRLFTDAGRRFTAVYRLRDSYSVIGTMRSNPFANGFPKDPAELKGHDLILLGSGSDDVLTQREINTLELYVSRGGTLIVLGGTNAFGPFRNAKFNSMMPVRSKISRFIPGNFSVETPDKIKIPGKIPAINLIDRIREGANVVLYAKNAEGNRLPLAVSMPYGRGQVTILLANTLVPENGKRGENFRKFWEQLLLNSTGSDKEKLKITASAASIPEGGRVEFRAFSEKANRVELELLTAENKIGEKVSMKKTAPNTYSAELKNIDSGIYTIRISAYSDSFGVIRRYLPLTAGTISGENDDLRVTDEAFQKFCAADRVVLPGETSALAERITESIRQQDVLREWFPFIESCWVPGIFILLLLAEWYLRRRFNMM